jgi:3-(3-hydroxy-phenyl)propionate hydroxylase
MLPNALPFARQRPGIYDVAVIGLGPTGATLANLLAEQGLTVLVLERDPTIYRLPRAIHMDGETMRIFQTAGIGSELSAHVLPAAGVRFISGSGRVLHAFDRSPTHGPQGWNGAYRFHQPHLESLLRNRLLQREGVTVLLEHELISIAEGEKTLQLHFIKAGGAEGLSKTDAKSATVRYAIGCDGARSTVRRIMEVALEDLKTHERWLVIDVLLTRPRPDLGDHGIQFCDHTRPATYIRGVGARRRWEFMLMPGDDAAALAQPESIWRLLSRWVTPDDAQLERPAVYTFHSALARSWRRGRLLIAGDAAHQTPPFLGQGMCAGIRDAANLAWKLAAVIRGKAEEALLDTYEGERAPHVRQFIDAAVRLGKAIQTTDPELAAKRDESLINDRNFFSLPDPRLGPGAHSGPPIAGTIGIQPFLIDNRRLDDTIGYQFALLVRGIHLAASAQLAATSGLAVVADPGELETWLTEMGLQAVLLRPDRYIAAVADSAADIPALIHLAVDKTAPKHGAST